MRAIKGFRDILPYGSSGSDTSYYWNSILDNLRQTMSIYNFSEIVTPVMEYDSTFKTGIGSDSDVSKEMYEFVLKKDLSGVKNQIDDSYCLRPEGTAPTVRSFIENSLYKTKKINKLFYLGPMFRYERSQKGRYRMFHQIGIELLGSKELYHEVEILHLAKTLLDRIGVKDYVFQINSIGDSESLKKISSAVLSYAEKHINSIGKDDLEILNKSPLRFLDKAIHKYKFDNVPRTIDFIGVEPLERFEKLKKILNDLEFNYVVNNQLVRGIDYYNDLVFEVTSKDLGTQNAILAGGRYDSLVHKLGGPKTDCIGFAAGIERIALLLDQQQFNDNQADTVDFYIAYQDSQFKDYSFKIADKLRNNNFKVEIEYEAKSFTKQMKTANKMSSKKVVIIGEDEFSKSLVRIKDMSSGEEKIVNFPTELEKFLEDIAS
ncbi:MAG: histidine--tRNA ligase [Thermodesulfobacteriota bacterium]|nr:histidine--tRNA ligase [Thermodesulfobacteriota bacterium]